MLQCINIIQIGLTRHCDNPHLKQRVGHYLPVKDAGENDEGFQSIKPMNLRSS